MAKKFINRSPNEVRRKDRSVDDEEWIRTFLKQAPYGVLATVDEQQPFINSNLFVYDEPEDAIYMHTAHIGRTQANVSSDEEDSYPVCFSVFHMGRLLPAKEALEFSVEYESVVVFGTAKILAEKEEKRNALQLLLDKYAPHLRPNRDYRPIVDKELKRTAVYRIDITSWSGKKKAVDSDFPGAFTYPITDSQNS